MHILRALRHSRDLSFVDVAQLTGIPVRMLAEAEYGLRLLTGYERAQLAFVYGVSEAAFGAPGKHATSASPASRSLKQGFVAAAMVTALVTSALRAREATSSLGSLPALPRFAIALTRPSVTATASPIPSTTITATATSSSPPTTTPSATATTRPTARPTATTNPTAFPSPTEPPIPMPLPAFVFTDAGPQGCPLMSDGQRIVITQGWGVGSHAPAETMGGVDLAIDGDSDGAADPGATLNAVVRATHGGVVRLARDSWPAGNHIWVVDTATDWRSGYGHLAAFLVADGQAVEAGQPIGLVGTTGMTTGPHLHYHVWRGDTNIDPTDLVNLCFQ